MTPAMREAYDFICTFISDKGYSPTYKEIGEAIGVKNKSGVHRIVNALQDRGYISILASRPRSIEITRDRIAPENLSRVRSYLVEISTAQQLSKAQRFAHEALKCLP